MISRKETTDAVISMEIGRVRISATPRGICRVHLMKKNRATKEPVRGSGLNRRRDGNPTVDASSARVRDQAAEELRGYFSGERNFFSAPLDLSGTPFQKAVWKALLEIPYGETRTYGEIAARIGRPGAARAVGMACNRNPVGIIVPCHRVVGAGGKLTGYAGGIDLKAKLLDLERRFKDRGEEGRLG